MKLRTTLALFWKAPAGLAILACASMAMLRTQAGDAPMIVTQPQSQVVTSGDSFRLSCVVTGTPPIALIWQRNDVFLADQTNATLTVTNAQPAHDGTYRLVAVSDAGVARSTNAYVIVYTNQPSFPWAWEAKLRGPRLDYPHTFVSGLALDTDGNIFVTGTAETTVDFSDFFLTAKYAPDGRLLWTASFSELGYQSQSARAIAVDRQGACYVTGYGAPIKPDFNMGYQTIKYDAEGRALWTNHWNAAPGSQDMAFAIAVDDESQSYILGNSGLIKLSPEGSLLWTNCTVRGNKLRVTAERVYAADTWNVSSLYCLDTNGTVLWQANYGNGTRAGIRDMTTDGSGCVYIAAATNYILGQNTGDIEVAKFDSTGSNVWTAVYAGPFGGADEAEAIAVDRTGAVVVTGSTWYTNRPFGGTYDTSPYQALTLRFDMTGKLVWSARYGSPLDGGAFGSSIAADVDGNIFVAGRFMTLSPLGALQFS